MAKKSEDIRKAIENSGFTDDILAKLYDDIEGMDDQTLSNYLYTNRKYFQNQIPMAIEEIPVLQETLYTKPTYKGKNIDFKKMFNDENVLDNIDKYSMKDIEYVAKKNGLDGKELLSMLYNAKTEQDRYNVAHGGEWKDILDKEKYKSLTENPIVDNLLGLGMTMFAPRSQEAIARGETPEAKDIALDVGEQALYAMPWNRAIGGLGKVGKVVTNIAGNAITPITTEVADAIAYDDENNPRSDFSLADVATGTTVNTATPWIIHGVGRKLDRYTGGKFGKTFAELAEGESAGEVAKREQDKFNKLKVEHADDPTVSADIRKAAHEKKLIADMGSQKQIISDIENNISDLMDNKEAYIKLLQDNGPSTKSGKYTYGGLPEQYDTPEEAIDGAIKSLNEKLKVEKANFNKNIDQYRVFEGQRSGMLSDIASQKGNTLEEKTINYLKKNKQPEYTLVGIDGAASGGTPSELYDVTKNLEGFDSPTLNKYMMDERVWPFIHQNEPHIYEHSPVTTTLLRAWDASPYVATEGLKTGRRLAGEEAIKNYLTNQFGTTSYANERSNLISPVTEYNKRQREINEQKKLEEEIKHKRWDKGFATPEEMKTKEYSDYKLKKIGL